MRLKVKLNYNETATTRNKLKEKMIEWEEINGNIGIRASFKFMDKFPTTD